jgi:glucose-1-phosphate thymidylyltransferase
MKALIAAGGRATRLRPITNTLNKHLIPLANRPMLEYVIEKIAQAGIRDIIINVNPGELETMRNAFSDGSRWNVSITYVEQQGGAKGIAHAVANAEQYLRGDSFLFYLGDNIMVGDLGVLKRRFESGSFDCLIALSRMNDPSRFGVPEFGPDGSLKRTIEKPAKPPSPFAVTGIYFFNDRYFDGFKEMKPSPRGEYEITDMITWFIDHGKVGHEEITGWWKDTGKPDDLLEGNALLLEQIPEDKMRNEGELGKNVTIQGKVSIGKGSVVGPEVVLQGPVVIGEGCHIENGLIGPNVSLGNDVQFLNSEIENSIVFNGARIDCGTRIADSIIGANAVVGSAERNAKGAHKLILGDQGTIEL